MLELDRLLFVFFQPGPRDGMIQCYIKRNRSKSTYHLYLCLSNGMLLSHTLHPLLALSFFPFVHMPKDGKVVHS